MSQELAKGLRALAALLEDVGSIPTAHMVADPGLLASSGTKHTSDVQTYLQAKYPFT